MCTGRGCSGRSSYRGEQKLYSRLGMYTFHSPCDLRADENENERGIIDTCDVYLSSIVFLSLSLSSSLGFGNCVAC